MFLALSSTTRIEGSPSSRRPAGSVNTNVLPLPELALDPDPAVVQLHEALRQRQPEPRPFALPPAGRGLLELLEDPDLVLRGDPRPVVADGDADLAVDSRRA